MRLYFALSTDPRANTPLITTGVRLALVSYFYYDKGSKLKYIRDHGLLNDETFWDSGAFSAFSLKKPINLYTYCRFIRDHELKIYASLDVIGSPEKSHDNYEYMKREFNLNPIPCFHIGEEYKHLDRILDVPYIALGGMVMASDIESWLDKVMNYIYTRQPGIKIHGFGMTDANLILKYPWYSVDSSSWTGCVRFARFSLWKEHTHTFFTITAREFYAMHNIIYNDGDPIVGDIRSFIIIEQIKQFQLMEKYLLNKKIDKDYNYITSQTTLDL